MPPNPLKSSSEYGFCPQPLYYSGADPVYVAVAVLRAVMHGLHRLAAQAGEVVTAHTRRHEKEPAAVGGDGGRPLPPVGRVNLRSHIDWLAPAVEAVAESDVTIGAAIAVGHAIGRYDDITLVGGNKGVVPGLTNVHPRTELFWLLVCPVNEP